MSNTKDWLMNLSARPEFIDGYDAYKGGTKRHESNLKGEALQAWLLGWDHAKWEDDPDHSGDDESEQPS